MEFVSVLTLDGEPSVEIGYRVAWDEEHTLGAGHAPRQSAGATVVRTSITIQGLSQEQRELWDRVDELWAQSRSRDRALIGSALHPQYVGWDMSTELPHDKDSAIESVTGDTPALQRYSLFPHSVQVYDHKVGVVHYSYSATVEPPAGTPLDVTGKWTEVYLKQGDRWTMVAVSGRPDEKPQDVDAAS